MLVSTDHANPRPRASERMAAPIAERTGPRRSPAWLLVCLLAVVTALLCYQVAASTVPPALPPPPPDRLAAAHVAVVSRFYAAVNTTLRTGETAMLESLVAEELIEHPAPVGTASGRAVLIQRVLALRLVFPHLQLQIDDLHPSEVNQVAARVHPIGVESGHFLGLPLPAGMTVWPSWEEFRVDGDQIVEYWGGRDPSVHLEPLFEARQPAPSSGTAFLQVAQVTYPPRTAVPLHAMVGGAAGTPPNVPQSAEADRRMTYLDAGALTLVDGSDGSAKPDAWKSIDVTPGTLLQAEPCLSAQTGNDESADVLDVTITGSAPTVVNSIPERAVDVQATVIGTAVVAVDDWAELAIAAGRVSLTPGATLAWPAAPGPTVLVVEAGAMELTAGAGRVAGPGAWLGEAKANRHPPDDPYGTGRSSAGPNQVPIPAGGTALLGTTTRSLWHNPGAEPATVLVLAITPTGEAPAASLATPIPDATSLEAVCLAPSGCR